MTDRAAPSISQQGDGTLAVSGYVTADNVVGLRNQGEQRLGAINSAHGEVEINLTGVENAHSILLSLLLCWQRAAIARHQTLIYSGISERLLSLSTLSGLNQHLPGFDRAPAVRPDSLPDVPSEQRAQEH